MVLKPLMQRHRHHRSRHPLEGGYSWNGTKKDIDLEMNFTAPGLRAGDKRHHGGYFFYAFKAVEERGGTYRLEEFLFHFGFRNVLLFRHARDEIAGTFRRRRARQNRVHGDTGSDSARPRATATWAVLVMP